MAVHLLTVSIVTGTGSMIITALSMTDLQNRKGYMTVTVEPIATVVATVRRRRTAMALAVVVIQISASGYGYIISIVDGGQMRMSACRRVILGRRNENGNKPKE